MKEKQILVTGNTVIDALYAVVRKIKDDPALETTLNNSLKSSGYDVDRLNNARRLVLITGHRRENFGEGFINMCTGIKTLTEKYPEITIADFDFYNVDIFNRCENSNDMLLAIKSWESVHLLMKILPVEWDYKMPYGLLYAKEPSEKVEKLVRTVEGITK